MCPAGGDVQRWEVHHSLTKEPSVAKKKRSSTPEKALKGTVKGLRTKLERAEARAERWKARAGRFEKAAAESRTQVRKLTKRFEKAATGPLMPRADPPHTSSRSHGEAPGPSAPDSQGSARRPATAPDASWTVARLRDEARSRGLTGYSGRTKAQLLELLS
jgi:hypothetical protein